MKKLYLNDLFPLTGDVVSNTKLVLNMRDSTGGKSLLTKWLEGDYISGRDVGFSYWSHYAGRRNFKVGQKVLGFLRIKENRYLFITAGRVLEVPNKEGPCRYGLLHEYDAFVGRLIVSVDKGNTFSRYVFRLDKYWQEKKIEVVEILKDEFQELEFNGYENVHLSFASLLQVLESEKYAMYRSHLASVKGVYCLTDQSCGKLYVGSAYGVEGVAQRWNCYLDTRTGNNKRLVLLHKKRGKKYFEENFTFTLLEFFDKKCPTEKIIARENYWKKALDTCKHGYNEK